VGLSSCEKDIPETNPLAHEMKLLSDNNVKWARNAVAGEGVVLLTYIDNNDNYQFKLIDNAGSEIWTKDFGYKFQITPASGMTSAAPDTVINILYDIDNTFAIFRGSTLKKINHLGEVVFSDAFFLDGMGIARVAKVMLGNQDSYLVLGELLISGSRAFVSEYSREGHQNFLKTYAVNVNGVNSFTDAQILDNGKHLLTGTFESKTEGLSSSFLITELSPDGDIGTIIQNDIECVSCIGRQLHRTVNKKYIYLISAIDENSSNARSRVYHFTDSGSILNVDSLDLSVSNLASSQSLIQNTDGSFSGLIKTRNDIPDYLVITGSVPLRPETYTVPVYSYYYTLNEKGVVQNKAYFNSLYSNYFSTIARLSDNRVLIYGAVQSFGEEIKLAIIFKQV